MRSGDGRTTNAARVEGDRAVLLSARDVGSLLAEADFEAALEEVTGAERELSACDFAPLVVDPAKIICVGLNYRDHIEEMGRELPAYPTLFAKFSSSLIGAHDDLVLPSVSQAVDWEVELGIVIGRAVRRAGEAKAADAIAGYTVVNDVSMRDWQTRTLQFLQGKTFDASTPVGPVLVTGDELGGAADLEVRCEVDGEVMQRARTSALLFSPAAIVSYISQFTTLCPGDLIATGTPGGVGMGRQPPVYLRAGQVLTTTVEGIGSCVNLCRDELA